MKIEHIALWTENLEQLKEFYKTYFDAVAGDKFCDENYQFSSYFLSFDSGARIELMSMPGIQKIERPPEIQHSGLIHIAFSLDSKSCVDACYERFQKDGLVLVDKPHVTSDNYYEFTVIDPDGNRIEVTA